MDSNGQTNRELEAKINAATEASRSAWRAYQERHGDMSLSTHIFMANESQGFPVLVKSHDETSVTCIILQNGSEFSVSMEEYVAHRGADFFLDRRLEESDKAEFERQASWFRRAYQQVGLEMCVTAK